MNWWLLHMLLAFGFKVLMLKQLKQVIYQLLEVMKQDFSDVGENNDLVVQTLNQELQETALIPNFPRLCVWPCETSQTFMFLCMCKNRQLSSLSQEFSWTSTSEVVEYWSAFVTLNGTGAAAFLGTETGHLSCAIVPATHKQLPVMTLELRGPDVLLVFQYHVFFSREIIGSDKRNSIT